MRLRLFVLGQLLATLVIVAIFLAAFAIFDGWNKPLEARTAAMAIAFFAAYPAIILFRLLVKAREWDGPVVAAFAAAAVSTIALMGFVGTVFAIAVVSTWSIVIGIRSWKDLAAGYRRRSWQTPYRLLWMQFLATLFFLGWLGIRGLP